MKSACQELELLAHNHGEVPIICGGDIFDKWNPPVELVNFVIDHLPRMYAVPGQHDLPYHRLDLDRCGYGALMRAGKVVDIGTDSYLPIPERPALQLWGFPWGVDLCACGEDPDPEYMNIAVCHHYAWTDSHKYPDAPEDSNLRSIKKRLKGFDVAIFGDNHKGWIASSQKSLTVINNGGFIRRTIDELDYYPSYSVIYDDGTAKQFPFQYSGSDKLLRTDTAKPQDQVWDTAELMEQLRESDAVAFDYREELLRAGKDNKLSKIAQEQLAKAVE